MTASRLSRILAASIPLLVAILIAKLWFTGTLRYYVNDRTVWIVLAGAVLFALVGAIAIRSAVLNPHDDSRLNWKAIAFLVPVLIGLVVPARPLSASSGQSSSLGALQLASHVSSGGGDAFGYWVNAIGNHPEASWWSGQRVTLVGFVARQSGLPPRTFITARYLVTCCVVDATLFGFPVQLSHGAIPPEGEWVQISGTFGGRFWTDPSGSQWPIVQRARVSPVSVPSSPYLSP